MRTLTPEVCLAKRRDRRCHGALLGFAAFNWLCHLTWAVCFAGLAFGTSTADSTSGWAGSEFRTVFFFFHFSPTRPWLQVGANVLAEELDRVASSFTGRQCRAISALSERAQMIQCNARRLGTGDVDLHSDCIPGRFSLELLMLLTHPGFNRTDGAMSLVRSKATLGQLNSCEYSGPFDGVWNASWHDSGLWSITGNGNRLERSAILNCFCSCFRKVACWIWSGRF